MGKVRLEFFSWIADTLGMTGRSSAVILEAPIQDKVTVKELLQEIAAKYPRFGQEVYDAGRRHLNESVAIYVNENPILMGKGLETELHDGDSLVFLPVIEGG